MKAHFNPTKNWTFGSINTCGVIFLSSWLILIISSTISRQSSLAWLSTLILTLLLVLQIYSVVTGIRHKKIKPTIGITFIILNPMALFGALAFLISSNA